MVDLAVRPALILATAWLVARCLARATPATRHLVWHAAIIAVLTAPILAPLTPRFPVAALPLDGATDIANEVIALARGAQGVSTSTPGTLGTSRTISTPRTSTEGTAGTLGTPGTLLLLLSLLGSLIVV